MRFGVLLVLAFMGAGCSTIPGRETPLRQIAVERAAGRFRAITGCAHYKLYKIKRINATQGERLFQFRIGGCRVAMDFFVKCVKWSHRCPEGKALRQIRPPKGQDSERLFSSLPLE